MIKYYPLTRVITNQYTRGNEYVTSDGRPYTGKYYKTYDGKVYAGINPTTGTNQLLTPVKLAKVVAQSVREYTAANSQNITERNTVPGAELQQLTPYHPVPLESDYTRGYFTRYFAKQLTGLNFILEISQTDWANMSNGLTGSNFAAYEVTSMLWQLTGPLKDQRLSQYQIQGGVYDTNKRVTEGKNKTFSGLVEFIGGDYVKYARIT